MIGWYNCSVAKASVLSRGNCKSTTCKPNTTTIWIKLLSFVKKRGTFNIFGFEKDSWESTRRDVFRVLRRKESPFIDYISLKRCILFYFYRNRRSVLSFNDEASWSSGIPGLVSRIWFVPVMTQELWKIY